MDSARSRPLLARACVTLSLQEQKIQDYYGPVKVGQGATGFPIRVLLLAPAVQDPRKAPALKPETFPY